MSLVTEIVIRAYTLCKLLIQQLVLVLLSGRNGR